MASSKHVHYLEVPLYVCTVDQWVGDNLCCLPVYHILWMSNYSLEDLVTSLIRCMFMGFLQLWLAHTCVMHGWMNMSAELTGFADHDFYQVDYPVRTVRINPRETLSPS